MAKNDNSKPSAKTAAAKPDTAKPKLSTGAKTVTQDPALLEFFKDELKDIYWAENHLVKALPKMIEGATSAALAKAISSHLKETVNHVKRLDHVFDLLGEKRQAKKCDAMDGITKEGEGILEDTLAGTATRDVGIIMASQKVEYYEIATYGGLVRLAQTLGLNDVAELLKQTLAEEKLSDEKLTAIAENDINYAAVAE